MARASRRSGKLLTPMELEIMKVLWDGGAATVAEAQGRLGSELAHTTVQTMLNVLLRKRKVTRTLEAGRSVTRPQSAARAPSAQR